MEVLIYILPVIILIETAFLVTLRNENVELKTRLSEMVKYKNATREKLADMEITIRLLKDQIQNQRKDKHLKN